MTQIGIAVAILLLAGGLFYSYQRDQESQAEARSLAREAERQEAEEQREAAWTRIQEESGNLIPAMINGVRLGQTLAQVRTHRPQLGLQEIEQQGLNEPGMQMFEEDLPNGGRAVYAFERATGRLQRLQMLSLLPTPEAIGPHLAAMNDQYGAPTGIWDCPQTGGVPTRRFTWRHGETTVSDIFLVYGGRVSVTLYIAPNPIILRSLRMAACQPIQSDQIANFPVTSPEQLMDTEPEAVPAP